LSGSTWGAPSLISLIVFTFLLAFGGGTVLLHCVGNTGILSDLFGLILLLGGIFALGFGLLGVGVSEHEEINHDVPFALAWDFVSELKGLAGKKPEHVGNGVTRLVVGGDGNINPVKGRVRVAKGNDGDVHVGGLGESLMVEAGVANDHESWLKEPIIKYKLEFIERKLTKQSERASPSPAEGKNLPKTYFLVF